MHLCFQVLVFQFLRDVLGTADCLPQSCYLLQQCSALQCIKLASAQYCTTVQSAFGGITVHLSGDNRAF